MDIPALRALEYRLGVRFSDLELLQQALTHRSFTNEASGADHVLHNERLEFLGDAVLGLIVAQMLMEQYPEAPEGQLTKMRASLVNGKRLAKESLALGLGDVLRLGRGEEKSGGREKVSILANVFEAVLAAAYIDGGMVAAQTIIKNTIGKLLANVKNEIIGMDSKSRLQEYIQMKSLGQPKYDLVSFSGPDHDRIFNVRVRCGSKVLATGTGKSKKAAEQDAAKNALSMVAGDIDESKEDKK